MVARLKDKYAQEIRPSLREKFGIGNVNAVPKIEKVCLNMGLGKSLEDGKILEVAKREMSNIAAQVAVVTSARISVSNFKLRQGYKIGCRVTLRDERMWLFLDKLMNVAIPQIRDFRGVKKSSFDRQGNYSLGIDEIVIFPEVDPDKLEYPLGMDVTMVIRNSAGPDQSRELLRMLGMPFAE